MCTMKQSVVECAQNEGNKANKDNMTYLYQSTVKYNQVAMCAPSLCSPQHTIWH